MTTEDVLLLRALLAETEGRMLKEVLAENRMYWHTEANRTKLSSNNFSSRNSASESAEIAAKRTLTDREHCQIEKSAIVKKPLKVGG